MTDLPSLFTPSRTRAEPVAPTPAPERRAPEPSGMNFARSLASVRGVDRSAAMQARAAEMRAAARDDARSDARSSDDSAVSTVRSRSQVQALMLSGAMKFAATRSNDAPVMVAGTLTSAADAAALTQTQATADGEQDVSEMDEQVALGAALTRGDVTVGTPKAASTIARLLPPTGSPDSDERVDVSYANVGEPVTPDASMSAAATSAAMQLVTTLPIVAEATVSDVAAESTAPAHTDIASGAANAAWSDRIAGMESAVAQGLLVEDHFDAPAVTTSIPVTPALIAGTLRDVVREPVTITVTGTARAATETTAPVATAKPLHNNMRGVERGVEQLAPEFRDRLQKVMERMKQEFGHDVTVVETVRSSARQAALFAQGRTTPGQVVTWTRNSKHSKGLAADLMVDGQWENPAGYAHLAQIAKQEGLRTLGARDPGHVELPADGSVSPETLGTLLGDLAGDAGDSARKVRADVELNGREQNAGAMARVADVAQVARVSQVANVSRVASVARPGASAARSEQGSSDAVSPLAVSAPQPQVMTDASSRLAAPVSAVNMADRISHLMDLQATQSAKPLNSVLLRMDNANGIEDQIRIDTRGTSVDAQLGLGTTQQAAELSSRVSELREALERRGLTADGVRVQAAPRATDSVNFSRMTAPGSEAAALRAGADAQAQSQGNPRDQASREQQHREALAREQERPTPRSSSDDARNRSRREQPETRQ